MIYYVFGFLCACMGCWDEVFMYLWIVFVEDLWMCEWVVDDDEFDVVRDVLVDFGD